MAARGADRRSESRPQSGADHRANRRILRGRCPRRAAYLLGRPLATASILGLELLKWLPWSGEHRHTRTRWQGRAAAQQSHGASEAQHPSLPHRPASSAISVGKSAVPPASSRSDTVGCTDSTPEGSDNSTNNRSALGGAGPVAHIRVTVGRPQVGPDSSKEVAPTMDLAPPRGGYRR